MKKEIKIKENKAITLIALIITIIILLILAGITISQLQNSGLFDKAKTAKEKYENAQNDENDKIAKYENEVNSYIDANRGTVTISEEEYQRLLRSSNSNYCSTEEQAIGKWIDGKILYQRTWTNLNITLSTSWQTIVNIPDIDTLVRYDFHIGKNVGALTNNVDYEIDSNNNLRMTESVGISYHRTIKGITVQYTKTEN